MHRTEIKSTLVVISGLGIATLTGFLRQIVIAQQFGVGRAADIYLVAFALPEFIFIALPIVLIPAFLPPYTACRQQAGEATAKQMARWATIALFVLLSAFTLMIDLFAPLIMDWLGPGFDPLERLRAIQSSRMMLPAIDLMGLAIMGGVVLQAYGRFFRSAFTTGLYNLTFVVVLFSLPMMLLDDRAAWGVTLGAAVALILQWPVWRSFFSHRPFELSDPINASPVNSWGWLKQVALLAGPLGLGYSVHHLILIIDRAMATQLGAGSVAALDYASRLAQAVGQLGGLAVSTVLFPGLVAYIESKNLAAARRSLAGALYLVWIITLPACLGLIILRAPLVQVLFERGAFHRSDTQMVSQVLTWFALSVLADAICQPLWRVLYAQRQTWTVVTVNGFQTIVRVFANIVFIRYFGYNGLALSAFMGLSLQALILGLLVNRKLGFHSTSSGWREAGFVTLAGVFAASGICLFRRNFIFERPVITIIGSGILGISIYILVLLCLKYIKKEKDQNRRSNITPSLRFYHFNWELLIAVGLVIFLSILPFQLVVKNFLPDPIGTYWKEGLLALMIVIWGLGCLLNQTSLFQLFPARYCGVSVFGIIAFALCTGPFRLDRRLGFIHFRDVFAAFLAGAGCLTALSKNDPHLDWIDRRGRWFYRSWWAG